MTDVSEEAREVMERLWEIRVCDDFQVVHDGANLIARLLSDLEAHERMAADLLSDLTAARKALEAAGWRPIETAPEDAPIYLTGFKWNLPAERWQAIGLRRGGEFFECEATGRQIYNDLVPPTHWMPLPSPPAARQDSP